MTTGGYNNRTVRVILDRLVGHLRWSQKRLNWTASLALTVDGLCSVVTVATGSSAAICALSKADDNIVDTSEQRMLQETLRKV